MITTIATGVAALANEWIGGKIADQKVKTATRLKIREAEATAKAELIKQKVTADIEWDLARANQVTWADELLTVIFAAWFVGNFIPYEPLQAAIDMGHERIAQAPDFMLYGFAVVMGAAFGYRKIVHLMTKR